MFSTFCGTRCREKKRNPSKNYSPPIPPTRIPYLLIPDLFYVRFLELSVFHFLSSFLSFLDPIGPHWTPISEIHLSQKVFGAVSCQFSTLQTFDSDPHQHSDLTMNPIGPKKGSYRTKKQQKMQNN